MNSASNVQQGGAEPGLRTLSPGLYSSLLDRFRSPSCALLERSFDRAVRASGLEHPAVIRAPGASFNPRPARLCQLVFGEALVSELDILAAAMLLTAPDPRLACGDDPELTAAADLAARALALTTGAGGGPALTLRLALILDTLRHLHMTHLSCAARGVVWDEARPLLPQTPVAQDSRLTTLIAAWGERFERSRLRHEQPV